MNNHEIKYLIPQKGADREIVPFYYMVMVIFEDHVIPDPHPKFTPQFHLQSQIKHNAQHPPM